MHVSAAGVVASRYFLWADPHRRRGYKPCVCLVSQLLFENSAINRERDETELCLAKWFIQRGKPVFGICRGMQIINVALGGTLWQDLPKQIGTNHETIQNMRFSVTACTKLHSLFGNSIFVNSFHHQAVKKPAERHYRGCEIRR